MSEVQLISKEIQVTKETSEIGDCGLAITTSIKAHIANGKKPGEAILAGVLDNAPKIVTAIQGYDKLSAEAKGETKAFVKGLADPVIDMVFKFMEKPAV